MCQTESSKVVISENEQNDAELVKVFMRTNCILYNMVEQSVESQHLSDSVLFQ